MRQIADAAARVRGNDLILSFRVNVKLAQERDELRTQLQQYMHGGALSQPYQTGHSSMNM